MIAVFGRNCRPASARCEWRRGLTARFGVVSLALLAIRAELDAAENWTQFRGPTGNGVARDCAPPTEWGPERNLRWKTKIPGVGWSQPIVWENRVFLTTAVSDEQAKPSPENNGPGFGGFSFGGGSADQVSGGQFGFEPPDATFRWQVLCIDVEHGQLLWEQTAREGRPTFHIHPNNTYASETPVTDGERVIAHFGMTGVYCYDLAGQPVWAKELAAYPTQFGWGTGSSPVLWEDRVLLQCDNDQESFLVALDKRTGDELWRIARDEKSNWSTPYLWTNRLRTELVTAGGAKMRSYDPRSGELLWEMKGQGRTSITPVGDEELLYVDSADRLMGIRGRLHAIRAGAKGDISLTRKEDTGEFVAWSAKLSASHLASPLLWNGRLYLLEQSAIAHCYDARSGQELERQRIPGASGFVASPLAASGRIYCLDQSGATLVLQPGEKLEVLATNQFEEMCWAAPAVAGNRLLLRGVEHLYCVGAQ